MEAERSIVLQKKMILFLSLMIITTFVIIYGREENTIQNDYVAEVNKLDLVTVNVSEDENEIIRKNVKYLATKTVVKEDLSLADVNDEKVEVFAGDVTGFVDENLDILSNNEEKVVVAVDNESTNDTNPLNVQEEDTAIESDEEPV